MVQAPRLKTIFLGLLAVILLGEAFATGTVKETPQRTALKLAFVGDIYLGGFMQGKNLKDPSYPFTQVAPVLNNSDILIGNLESPLSLKGEVWLEKTFTLQTDPRTVQSLKFANFSVLTLANNHIMDFGPEALAETLAVLDKNNIKRAGAGMNLAEARRPAILDHNGLTIAVLAYNNTFPLEFNAGPNRPGTAYGDLPVVLQDIRAVREKADIVIVAFHWSAELLEIPKDYQRIFAKKCIAAGANIVIGHHPHILQPLEVIDGGLVAYSLGNFAFASMSRKVKDSVILLVECDEKGPYRAVLVPLNVNNPEVQGQTRIRHGEDGARVIRHLQKISTPFNTQIHLLPDGTGELLLRPSTQ